MGIVQSDGKGGVLLSDGKWYNQFTGKPLYTTTKHKRYRATAVILDDNKVLLVRDRGKHDYSLPGGGFKRHESTIQAGAREVAEELGIKVISSKRLKDCDISGKRAFHKVCLIEIDKTYKPYLKSNEIDDFVWWDMKQGLRTQGHVMGILKKLGIL